MTDERAECPIYVNGYSIEEVNRYGGEGPGVIKDARLAIIRGGRSLLGSYLGMKRYDGFYQRSDHPYGYGPAHGSIVFQIGLTAAVRSRLNALPQAELSDGEKELALAALGTPGLEQVTLRMLAEEQDRLQRLREHGALMFELYVDCPDDEEQDRRRRLESAMHAVANTKRTIRQLDGASRSTTHTH